MTPAKREYVLDALNRYWGNGRMLVEVLPVARHGLPEPLQTDTRAVTIELPDWAMDACVDGSLLVPQWAADQAGHKWQGVDWYAVCFWYLHNCAERAFEKINGPVHSYSYRLKGIDEKFWSHAWVNRIAIFLRKWATSMQQADEVSLFGELPEAKIHISHDVDAVKKTFAIRIKQAVFHGFNALRFLIRGKVKDAVNRLAMGLRFFFSRDDYWCFDQIMALEKQHGLKSTFNLYAGKSGNSRNYKERLLDPAYNVRDPSLRDQLRQMHLAGWTIGLHPSFDAWSVEERMIQEKNTLEDVLCAPVTTCRQHWLRFSFEKTWKVQKRAGIKLDTTLGFNDRPGFRNSTALMISPWDENNESAMEDFLILPLVFMDSHFYDYQLYSDEQRQQAISCWVNEIVAVGGEATVLWHQRVMSRDYGWADGFRTLLDELNK